MACVRQYISIHTCKYAYTYTHMHACMHAYISIAQNKLPVVVVQRDAAKPYTADHRPDQACSPRCL